MVDNKDHIAKVEHPFGYIKGVKIYLKSFLSFSEREIGTIKDSEEVAIAYFTNRFAAFEKKVTDLLESIEIAENKGSFLQKLLHLKELCNTYDGLGDFESVYKKLEEIESSLQDAIVKNRSKNLVLKQTLIDELEVLKDSNDWINTGNRIKEIKAAWIRIGPVEKSSEQKIEEIFKNLLDIFFNRRSEFFVAREEMMHQKVKMYELLAIKAEGLKNHPDLRATGDVFKKLAQEWKAVGIVPRAELDPFMKRYKSAVDYFFRRVKEAKKNKPSFALPNNSGGTIMDKFQAIYNEANRYLTELPHNGDIEIKKLQEQWRNLGYQKVPLFKELDQKFKSICNKALDIYFLNKVCQKRNPGLSSLSSKDQLRFKITILKELIARDTEQIENFENNFSKQEVNSQDNSFDKIFGIKLQVQKKGLITKQLILKELEEML